MKTGIELRVVRTGMAMLATTRSLPKLRASRGAAHLSVVAASVAAMSVRRWDKISLEVRQ